MTKVTPRCDLCKTECGGLMPRPNEVCDPPRYRCHSCWVMWGWEDVTRTRVTAMLRMKQRRS